MIIGIDIDGTINNLCECVLNIYNKDSGDNLKTSDITQYYIENFVKDEYKENFYKYFVDKRVWKLVEINKEAQYYINKLNSEGHEIYFVTSTEAENVKKQSDWLKRCFPNMDIRKRLIICHNKQLLSELTFLIDDYQKNLLNGKYKKIILSYPWNIDFDCNSNGIFRANNWKEIYDIIYKEMDYDK